MSRVLGCMLALLLAAVAVAQGGIRVMPVSLGQEGQLRALPVRVVGRASQSPMKGAPMFQRQWPGTYFETAFVGRAVYFKLGRGDVILKVVVDSKAAQTLVKPAPALYQVDGLSPGAHQVRVQVVTESQAGPTEFDGFYGRRDAQPKALSARRRQIEFIGDSHTVGYGNTSPKRECGEEEVWRTTDTSQGIPPRVARRYDADYQVNAISGRGIVRNYDGFVGDTLPIAYPYVLFDHNSTDQDPTWRPQVIVISLGTNDFSTPLHTGEKWKSREELHTDYEQTYVKFVQDLRAKNPDAYFFLWSTDTAEGEIASEVKRVVDRLHASGETRVVLIPITGLEFSACNYHPSLADDQKIANAVSTAIAAGTRWK
jgi:lysophospholipase L1-like esterase